MRPSTWGKARCSSVTRSGEKKGPTSITCSKKKEEERDRGHSQCGRKGKEKSTGSNTIHARRRGNLFDGGKEFAAFYPETRGGGLNAVTATCQGEEEEVPKTMVSLKKGGSTYDYVGLKGKSLNFDESNRKKKKEESSTRSFSVLERKKKKPSRPFFARKKGGAGNLCHSSRIHKGTKGTTRGSATLPGRGRHPTQNRPPKRTLLQHQVKKNQQEPDPRQLYRHDYEEMASHVQ